ncbi:Pisatin demethylase [Fusarium acutatum]|uniref:Pisatin demethylase n=1 Tax=Fusarium acutatum TaxID=78861 RepID=A0A8H4JFG3_9HYPO|nr:Pisatin demethylase [Fusarium acutatum]
MAFLRDAESNPTVQAILSRLQHVDTKAVAVGLPLTLFGLTFFYYFIALLYSLFLSPLRNIPGPFLARVTRWWEYRLVKQGNSNQEFIRLHKKYGPVVRVGPNRYSLSQPKDVKKVYELGGKYIKTTYYNPLLSPVVHEQNIFAIQDNALHKERRRKISPMYTMSSMVSYEPAVDEMTHVCIRKLNEFAKEDRLVDIPHWMQYYAFDVIGAITFNNSFNMMENEGDTTGMIKGIREANNFLAFWGIVPNLVPWLIGIATALGTASNTSTLASYALTQIDNKRKENAKSTVKGSTKYDTFLKKLLEGESEGRLKMPNLLDVCSSNIGAGSDTTAVTLSSALYYLFQNPDKLKKLREEIDQKAANGCLSDPVTFQEAQDMPYLQAVIKETLRIHPAVGTILPRVVPRGGMELSGIYFPEGTEVGVNAWVLHYDKEIYGPDPEVFRPERWIGDEKTSMMDSMMFAFGGGSRTCIGRNISLLELTKVVPQIVRKFDLVIEDVEKPLDTFCAWFVYPYYNGRFKVRE